MGLVIATIERAGLLVGAAGEPIADAGSLLDALSSARDAVRLARGGVVFEIDVDLGARGPGRAA